MDYIDIIGKKHPGVKASCVGNSTVYSNVVWEGGDPLPSKQTLDDSYLVIAKEEKWEKIKAERERRKTGGVTVSGKWFHSDDSSRIQQIGLVMLGANIPAGLEWKTMDGSFITMTATLAGQIFNAVAASDVAIFDIAEQHRQNMLASQTPESYDFSGLWPQTYEEYRATHPV